MALLFYEPDQNPTPTKHKTPKPKTQKPKQKKIEENPKPNPKPKPKSKPKQQSSWDQFKNLLTCKEIEGSKIHDPSKPIQRQLDPTSTNQPKKLGSSCSSICSFKDVAHGNTRVVHRADNSPESSSVGQETGSAVTRKRVSTRSNGGGGSYTSSSRTMQFRKLSGCYECRMIVDPSRYPISPRVSACTQCGEVFPKIESLEIHQAVRHAVSELGPEDSGRNIVEIIFKSSWLKKDGPICKIDRILKVHNPQRTIQRFEECRDAVKSRTLTTTRKNPRCAADGNELLRFHCTTLSCSLGARGSSALCGSIPGCGVCTIIRHGLQGKPTGPAGLECKGVRTTASSGRGHDLLKSKDVRRAMLVCRVIAGRVKRVASEDATINGGAEEDVVVSGSYDSVAGYAGAYSNIEELFVFNPRAILPCFVVIYNVIEG